MNKENQELDNLTKFDREQMYKVLVEDIEELLAKRLLTKE